MVSALDRWVQDGEAPETIIAIQMNQGKVQPEDFGPGTAAVSGEAFLRLTEQKARQIEEGHLRPDLTQRGL